MYQNPQNLKEQYYDTISNLSLNDHYFTVYYKPEGYYKSQYPNMKPQALVYQQEEKTFQDLMKQFISQHPQFDLSKGMNWQLYDGLKIAPSLTVEKFKKELRAESVDGYHIFAYQNTNEWVDEAAITALLKTSKEFNSQSYEAPFYIQYIKYYMYLSLNPEITLTDVKKDLQKEILRVLKYKIEQKDIEFFFQKHQIIVKASNEHLRTFNNSSQQKFIVRFNKQFPLKLPPSENNTFITIRGNGIQTKKFEYDLIKNMKLSDVIEGLILNKKEKKYAIIIEGQLMRYNEQLSKFDKFFRNQSKVTKHIIGHYVNECLAFQFQYQKLVEKGQVNIEKIHIKQKDNIQRIRQCDKIIKQRAFSATQSHFKSTTNIQPILFYTSEIVVVGSDDRKNKTSNHLPIYTALNTFMRTNSFCDTQMEARFQPWEYKFAAHLYFQQKKIKPLKNITLWRGIKYRQICQIGEQIHFPQFGSTSMSKKQAEKFATTGLFIILNAKHAHPIKQYSFYQTQEQALVEPYSTWKVKRKWNLMKSTIQSKSQQQLLNLDQKTYLQWRSKQKGPTIDLIIVEDLEKPKLPQMKSSVFLLVDDKPGEGKAIWQNIEQIKNTTLMIQFLSTAQLKKWLQQQSAIVNDSEIEFVMITNMTRVQNGIQEKKAGIYAMDTFYKYVPNGTVFMYIGWLKGTLNKLKQHKYVPNKNLIVSNQFKDMVAFLKLKGIKRK